MPKQLPAMNNEFAFGIGRVDYVFGRAQDYSNITRHA
jgi:hypothetical protein